MSKISKLADKFERKMLKKASLNDMVRLLNTYPGTAEFLQDLVLAQYELIGDVPNNSTPNDPDLYAATVDVANNIASIIDFVRETENQVK